MGRALRREKKESEGMSSKQRSDHLRRLSVVNRDMQHQIKQHGENLANGSTKIVPLTFNLNQGKSWVKEKAKAGVLRMHGLVHKATVHAKGDQLLTQHTEEIEARNKHTEETQKNSHERLAR